MVGADELSKADQQSLAFGEAFERGFLSQGATESREIAQSLDMGWDLLSTLPVQELTHLSMDDLARFIRRE